MKRVITFFKWLAGALLVAALSAVAVLVRKKKLKDVQEDENKKTEESLAAQQKAKEAELTAIAANAKQQQENILAAHQEKLDAIATAAHDQEKALAADPSAASDALGAALDGARDKLEPKA